MTNLLVSMALVSQMATLSFFVAGWITGLICFVSGILCFLALTSGNTGHTSGFGDGLAGIALGIVSFISGGLAVICFTAAGLLK